MWSRYKIAVDTRRLPGLHTQYVDAQESHLKNEKEFEFAHINITDVWLELRVRFWMEYVFKLSKKKQKGSKGLWKILTVVLGPEANSSLKCPKTYSAAHEIFCGSLMTQSQLFQQLKALPGGRANL